MSKYSAVKEDFVKPTRFLCFQRQEWCLVDDILSHAKGARFLMLRDRRYIWSLLHLSKKRFKKSYAHWQGEFGLDGLDAIEHAFCPQRLKNAQRVEDAIFAYIVQAGLVETPGIFSLQDGVLISGPSRHRLPMPLKEAFEAQTTGVARLVGPLFQPFEHSFGVEPSMWSHHQRLAHSARPWQALIDTF